jgi:hypothetical protein
MQKNKDFVPAFSSSWVCPKINLKVYLVTKKLTMRIVKYSTDCPTPIFYEMSNIFILGA